MNYMLPIKLAEKFEKEAICRSGFFLNFILLKSGKFENVWKFQRIRKANSPVVDKIMELLCYWNLMDWLRPFIRKAISLVLGDCLRDLEQIDTMTGPRIIKSHLPLYLLNPEVLNTSKVCIHILSPLLSSNIIYSIYPIFYEWKGCLRGP